MPQFLCLVIGRRTGKTLKEYPSIEASNFYCARHRAVDRFENEEKSPEESWYVDSLELEIP